MIAQETAVKSILLSATHDFLRRKCPCGAFLSAPDIRLTSHRTWEAFSCHRLPLENLLSPRACQPCHNSAQGRTLPAVVVRQQQVPI